MLLIPYEEHSQQEKGGKEHGYNRKEVESHIADNLPWGARRNVPECAESYYREIWDSKDPNVSKF